MIVHSDINGVRAKLDTIVGQKINLTSKRGHKRVVERKGVIEKTYPSIFVVRLESPASSHPSGRLISYSYTDVLTNAIELSLCSADGNN